MFSLKNSRKAFNKANRPIKSVKKDDTVKVITGKFKGQTGKVLTVSTKDKTVTIDGLGVVTRHIKPNQFNPRGGEKQVQLGIDVSKIVKVDDSKASAKKPAVKPTAKAPKNSKEEKK